MIKGFFYRLFFSFSFLLLFSLNHIDYASPAPLGEHPLIAGWKAAGFAGGEIEIEGWSIIAEQFTPLSVLQKSKKLAAAVAPAGGSFRRTAVRSRHLPLLT